MIKSLKYFPSFLFNFFRNKKETYFFFLKIVLCCFSFFGLNFNVHSQAKYYITSTNQPWNSSSNINAMNTVFGNGNWVQGSFQTINVNAMLQPTTCFIYIDGSDQTSNALNSFLTPNLAAFQTWVANGGRLFLNAAPNQGTNINFGFGGVTLNYNTMLNSSFSTPGVAAPGQSFHPVFTGTNTPCATSFTGNWFAHGYISGGGTTPIIVGNVNANPLLPSLTELTWGSGLVLFGGMTTANFHSPQPAANNLLNNILSYMYVCCPISAVASPTSVCLGSGTTLTGLGAVTYTWLPSTVSPTIVVTPSVNSVYTVVATNSIGCQNAATVSVVVDPPCINVTSSSITCAHLGSATVTSNGGIGPFSYTWMPTAQTNSVATGLSPGTYTLTVHDFGNNFTYSVTTSFTSLVPLTGFVNTSPSVSCNGAATGTANVTNIAGGSGNQYYLWSNGPVTQTTAIASNLSAGVWSVTVSDALTGCTINQIFFITQPSAQVLNLSSSSPTACIGTSITLTGTNSGGTPGLLPPYTYTWVSGPQSDTYTVSPLLGGTYTYSLHSKDANNCLVSNTISVDFITNPILNLSNTSICPLQTGTLTVSGATTYTWSNNTTGSSLSDNPLITTNYSVIGSAQSCSSTASASIIIKPLPVPVLNSNSPICNGQNLNLYGQGGSSYQWTGPLSYNNLTQNPQLNGANPNNSGVYHATVTAANSCTAASSITVTVNPTPTISAFGSTVCVSQTLNLTSNSFAGSAYYWQGPNAFSSQNQNPSIVNPVVAASGNYTVIATSPVNCTNSAVANVTVTAMPIPTFTSNSPQCVGANLNFNSSNTTGAIAYSWAGPSGFTSNQTNPAINTVNLSAAGAYTLTVTTGPCVNTVSHNVIINALPTPTAQSNSPVCETKNINLSVNTSGVTYIWTGPNAFTGNLQNIVMTNSSQNHTGVYTVLVTDVNGCQASSSTSVTVMPNPVLTTQGSRVCYGEPASLLASGAANYQWFGPLGYSSASAVATITSAINTAVWTYYVVGTGLNTCTTIATATVATKVLPLPTAQLTPRVCVGSAIFFQAQGGNSYFWQGPLNFISSQQNYSLQASNVGMSGSYTLMVIDTAGCKGYTKVSTIIDASPGGSIAGDNKQSCVPFCANYKLYASGSSSIVSSSWSIGNESASTQSFNYCFSNAGNYTLRGSFIDEHGCKGTVNHIVNAYPIPVADFNYYPENPVENQDEVVFTNMSQGPEQQSWNWQFISNAGYKSQKENTSYTFKEAGTYPIALITKNTWGCADTVVKSIKIDEDFHVYVPNAFTPNGDGKNETFNAQGTGIKKYSLQVFNRWGQKVFETTDLNTGWNGTFRGEDSQTGTYAWKISATNINGKTKELVGELTLYR